MKAKRSAMKAKRPAMKVKKSTGMKKKAMKVSKIARGRLAKSQVFSGRKEKTIGGSKKADLKKNKHGKVVSKKMSLRSSRTLWPKALVAARKALGVKGFMPCGGRTPAGKRLLEKTRTIYKSMKK